MKRVSDGTGAGDAGVLVNQQRANAQVPEKPGYESEGAYRHHDHAIAEEPEQSSGQSVPLPVPAPEVEQLQPQIVDRHEPLRHAQGS